jgi:hypothetical protein
MSELFHAGRSNGWSFAALARPYRGDEDDWEDYEIIDPRTGRVTEDKPLA